MKLAIVGQLRGPECRRVMTRAVALRKMLEPWFLAHKPTDVSRISIALRVAGSLGDFGPETAENFQFVNKELECDLVIADHGWAELSDAEIDALLRLRVLDAIESCFTHYALPFNRAELWQLRMDAGNTNQ